MTTDPPDVVCPHCGDLVPPDELVTWQTARQTHWSPAEYEDGCERCAPSDEEPPDGDDDGPWGGGFAPNH